jgi:hypothetical protein
MPLGHWRLWARLLNYYSSPLESPMDVFLRLRRRQSQRGSPPSTSAVPLPLFGCLYVYDLPPRLTSTTCFSTTCFYGLPLRPVSTACLYGLPLRPASTACLYRLPLRPPPASTSTACLYSLPLRPSFIILLLSSSLSISCSSGTSIFFSFICDLCFPLLHLCFSKLTFLSPSNCAVEGYDLCC